MSKNSTSNKYAYAYLAPFDVVLAPGLQFANKAINFLGQSAQMTRSDFSKHARDVLTGFALVGAIGFVVKLVTMPLNSYLTPT